MAPLSSCPVATRPRPPQREHLRHRRWRAERSRFEAALDTAAAELKALQEDVSERLGPTEGDIFGAQALVLAGSRAARPRPRVVRAKRINVEAALVRGDRQRTRATLEAVPDDYLRERAADVRDVARRVLSTLIESPGPRRLDIPERRHRGRGGAPAVRDGPPRARARARARDGAR